MRRPELSPFLILALAGILSILAIETGWVSGSEMVTSAQRHQRQIITQILGIGVLSLMVGLRRSPSTATSSGLISRDLVSEYLSKYDHVEPITDLISDVEFKKIHSLLSGPPEASRAASLDEEKSKSMTRMSSRIDEIRMLALSLQIEISRGEIDGMTDHIKALREASDDASQSFAEISRSSLSDTRADEERAPIEPESLGLLGKLLKAYEKLAEDQRLAEARHKNLIAGLQELLESQ